MNRQWTPPQREAIDLRDRDILISAAAGSGKTAVLTQRIIERLTDPADPLSVEDLLVVTFSKAAAGELQARIRAAVEDKIAEEGGNRRLQRQLLLLERAEISTIHSFCLSLIRKNATELGLPVSMRVCDDGERSRIATETMDRLLSDLYSDGGEEFSDFAAQIAVLSDENLPKLLLSLYEKATNLPEGVDYFAHSARRMEQSLGGKILSGEYGRLLRGYLEGYLGHYAPLYQRAVDAFEQLLTENRAAEEAEGGKERTRLHKRSDRIRTIIDFYRAEWDTLSGLRAYTDDYDRLFDAVQAVTFARKESLTGAPEEVVETTLFRDHSKDEFEAMKKQFFYEPRKGHLQEDLLKTTRLLSVLADLMLRFDRRFAEEKQRLGLLDYADLERYTHRLLVKDGQPTDLARSVATSYREIYIDEYQDVNRIQDEIFSAIATANRFMVGDIKQSIYSFRGAEPSIFADYRGRFDRGEGGQTIYLSHNFRCDGAVVNFVNLICADLFAEGGTVRYTEGDRLIRGKAEEEDAHLPVQVILLQKGKADEEEELLSGREAEAEYVAREAKRLWDEEGVEPKDMALLLRAMEGRVSLYEEAFKRHGIPCVHNRAMPFFEEPEVLALLTLLHTIDNPTGDIDLAGALTGPVFGLTLEELISLRRPAGGHAKGGSLYEALLATEGDPRVDYFKAWLEEYRRASCTLSSDELIRKLYAETALPAIVAADPIRGKAAESNLRAFYQLARSFEQNNFRGLHRFLRQVDTMAQRGQGIERPAEEGNANALQIMTIHHSKGLEFKVCFLSDTGAEFDHRDAKADFLFHRDLGLAMTLRDRATLGKYQTLPRQILARKVIEDAMEEEMRNLYVAMTRAKQRLYVTAWLTYPKSAAERARALKEHFSYHAVTHATRYIDWIMGALETHPDAWQDYCKVSRLETTPDGFVPVGMEIRQADPAPSVDETAEENKVIGDETAPPLSADALAQARMIGTRYAFVYPHAPISELPAKLSVSRLTPDLLDEEEPVASLQGITMKRTPDFLQRTPQGLSGAERGTATHLFMQFCDFATVDQWGIDQELLRLVDRAFLSPTMADAVSRPALEAFFASDLYGQIRTGSDLLREFRFNVQLPASDFVTDPQRRAALADAKLLVQGVVDCLFRCADGSLKLIDYKTDRLGKTPAEGAALLWERYADQLYYYQQALEKILGEPVRRISLYSFRHGVECPLPQSLFARFGISG